jgi:ribosomal protein S18 acetylase RimI-like enzyme
MTKQLIQSHLIQVLEIDKKTLGFVGIWDSKSYLTDYQCKWELSNLALQKNLVIGLIVASQYNETKVHIHRFIIDPKYQNQGVGFQLFTDFEKRCKESNKEIITVEFDGKLKVEGFYLKLGFQRMSKDEIIIYLKQKEKSAFKGVYLSGDDPERYVYHKKIKGEILDEK